MSKKLQKSSGDVVQWWENRPTWQKWAIGGTASVLVVATGSAIAYAIATYGATVTITTTSATVTVAIGKAASRVA